MANPVNNNNKTVYLSAAPLLKYNSYMGKVFSPLPKEGKFFEVIKRISAVIIAPLAYLVLSLIAFLGLPFTRKAAAEKNEFKDDPKFPSDSFENSHDDKLFYEDICIDNNKLDQANWQRWKNGDAVKAAHAKSDTLKDYPNLEHAFATAHACTGYGKLSIYICLKHSELLKQHNLETGKVFRAANDISKRNPNGPITPRQVLAELGIQL